MLSDALKIALSSLQACQNLKHPIDKNDRRNSGHTLRQKETKNGSNGNNWQQWQQLAAIAAIAAMAAMTAMAAMAASI